MENTKLEDFDINDIKNIKISSGPSLEEKIDYIYKTLKAQKRNAYIKAFLKIFVLLLLVFFFLYYIPNLPQEKKDAFNQKISNFASENISKLVQPIVQNVVGNTVKNMNIGGENISIPSNLVGTGTDIDSTKLTEELQRKLEIMRKMQNK